MVTALVNNAGTILPQSRVEGCEVGALELLFKVNVVSQFLCARETIRRMSTSMGVAAARSSTCLRSTRGSVRLAYMLRPRV